MSKVITESFSDLMFLPGFVKTMFFGFFFDPVDLDIFMRKI